MRLTFMAGTLALAACLFAAAGPPRAGADEGATLAALQLAFQREVNAQWHYQAFASAARREGHPEIASLFRAVACGEAVHAASHRAQIERLGAVAPPRIESVVVRSTAENLASSIENERVEREKVYRVFADFARAECDYEALASINYARGAEATHLRMFSDALDRLEAWKHGRQLLASLFPVVLRPPAATGPAGLVCPGCGSVFPGRPRASCPNCGTAGATFIVFL